MNATLCETDLQCPGHLVCEAEEPGTPNRVCQCSLVLGVTGDDCRTFTSEAAWALAERGTVAVVFALALVPVVRTLMRHRTNRVAVPIAMYGALTTVLTLLAEQVYGLISHVSLMSDGPFDKVVYYQTTSALQSLGAAFGLATFIRMSASWIDTMIATRKFEKVSRSRVQLCSSGAVRT